MKKNVSSGIIALCSMLTLTLPALDLIETSQDGSRTQDLIHHFESERALAQGNPIKALKKIDPISQGAQQSRRNTRIRALLLAEQFNQLAQETNDFPLNDLEMQLAFLQAYTSTNQIQKAESLLESLQKEHPHDEQLLYVAANFYTQISSPEKALKIIDTALKQGSSEYKKAIFLFLKAKIYATTNRYQESLDAINQTIATSPQFDKAYLLKAALLSQANKRIEAIATYKKYLSLAGDDADIIKQLVKLLYAEKQFSEALSFLEKINEDTAEHYFNCALLSLNAAKKDKAFSYIEKALTKNPNLKKAQALNLSILLSEGKTEEALSAIEKSLQTSPGDLFTLKMLPELLKSGIHPQAIASTLERVQETHKDEKNLLAALADLYISFKQFDKALACCDSLINITRDDLLKSKALFQKAYISAAQNNYSPVEELLLSALKTKNVFIPAYNFLALYYASKTNKLSLAQKYIAIALEKEPNNNLFLKTKKLIEEKKFHGSKKKI